MYAICNVIYGVPLKSNDNDTEQPEGVSDCIENEEPGFLSYYSGAGIDYTPAGFGIELCEFDEACHHIDISTLKLEPTQQQIEKYNKLYEALTLDIKKELEMYGKPRVFFLWSTS